VWLIASRQNQFGLFFDLPLQFQSDVAAFSIRMVSGLAAK
jgi:hypothetical protein